jgi:hypothetical protein
MPEFPTYAEFRMPASVTLRTTARSARIRRYSDARALAALPRPMCSGPRSSEDRAAAF